MAKEESHPSGPNLLECLRETLPGQSELSAQNPGAGVEQHESTRRGDATDRRLLCRLRGRSGHREERAGPHQAGIGSHSAFELGARAGATCGAAADGHRRVQIHSLPGRVGSGSRRFGAHDCLAGSGRIGAAGPRLLHERGCEIEGDARAVRKARTEDIRTAGRQRGNGQEKWGDADAHGNRAGKGFDGTRGAAQPVQPETQNGDSRTGRAGAEFRLEGVLQSFTIPQD